MNSEHIKLAISLSRPIEKCENGFRKIYLFFILQGSDENKQTNHSDGESNTGHKNIFRRSNEQLHFPAKTIVVLK